MKILIKFCFCFCLFNLILHANYKTVDEEWMKMFLQIQKHLK